MVYVTAQEMVLSRNFLMIMLKILKIIGSDISDTANNFKNSVVWDFHEINDAW